MKTICNRWNVLQSVTIRYKFAVVTDCNRL